MNNSPQEKERGMTSRMAPMFIVVFCFSLILNAFLDYSNFKRNHTEIERSRFSVVISDLQDTAEYALNLGVSIRDFSQLQQMIENTQKRYPEITQINVIDTSGISIYNTDKAQINKKSEQKWLQKALNAKDQWHDSDESTQSIGVPVVNSINIINASLVITYSQKNLIDKLTTVRGELIKVTLILMAIFSALIFFGLKWINRGFEKTFHDMKDKISQTELSGPTPEIHDDPEMKGFLEGSKKAYSSLEEIEAELASIEGQTK